MSDIDETQLTALAELLADPAAVHLNMLRGGIAKPSWANIQHLYPEEFAKLRAERDAAARDMRERCKAVADADVRLCEQMQHDAETVDIASRWAVCKQTAEKIGNAIAALPDAVIATSGKDAT